MSNAQASDGAGERDTLADAGRGRTTAAVLSPGSGLVPDWLVNVAALGWRLLAIAALGVVLWSIAALLWAVTASIAISVVVAAAFTPLVLRLRAGGRSPTMAAAIVWAAAVLGIGAVLVLLLLAFVPYLGDAITTMTDALAKLQSEVTKAIPALGQDFTAFDEAGGVLAETAGRVVAGAADVVTVLVLTTFLVFFFLRDGDRAWAWAFQAVESEKRAAMTLAGHEALLRVGGYLRGTTLLSAIIALTDFAFMMVLGVPLAVPLAVLVFISGYIPYFGGIVTTFVVLLVTWGAVGPAAALAMIVLIAIRNAFLAYWVRPTVLGRSVSIHPAVVLIVLPAGFQLAGVVGLFAAVPVTAVAMAVASAARHLVEPDEAPPLPGLVSPWLDRLAQWSWRLLVAIGLVGILVGIFIAVPLVLLPIVLALVVAATADPLVHALTRRGWTRSRSAALVIGGGFIGVIGILLLAALVLVRQVSALVATAIQGAVTADGTLGLSGFLADAASSPGREIASTATAVASSMSSLIVVVVLGVLLGFYFSRDGARLGGRIAAHARPDAAAPLREAGGRAFSVLGGYMVGTAAISFVGAASQLVIMLILGLPLALPVFVLSFFLCFIPYIGGFISTGVAFLIAVAVGSPTDILVMALWTLVFNIVTGNIVSPLVYGRTVHLHPAVVLVAIPAAGAVAGILGMFLVVPAIGVVSATWRTVLAVLAAREAAAAAAATGQPDLPAPVPPA